MGMRREYVRLDFQFLIPTPSSVQRARLRRLLVEICCAVSRFIHRSFFEVICSTGKLDVRIFTPKVAIVVINLPVSQSESPRSMSSPVLSAGFAHAALVRDGCLVTWGQSTQGCLGKLFSACGFARRSRRR